MHCCCCFVASQVCWENSRLPGYLHCRWSSHSAAEHQPYWSFRQVMANRAKWPLTLQKKKSFVLFFCLFNNAYIYLSGSPPRWSGNTQRKVRRFECQSGRAESFPSRLWSDETALCLSNGRVRLSVWALIKKHFSFLVKNTHLAWHFHIPVLFSSMIPCQRNVLVFFFFFAFSDGPKDTSPEDALENTYVPSLKTLEEEVMEKLGIQETRRHQRSYWYWTET